MTIFTRQTNLTVARGALGAVAIAMAAFHIYVLGFSLLDPWLMNLLHFQFVTILALLTTTWRGKAEAHLSWSNMILLAASLAYGLYIFINYDDLSMRAGIYCESFDLFFSALAVLLTFELVRRVSGLPLAILTGLFVAYCIVGPWMPGLLWHKGYTLERIFPYFFSTSGMFNVPMSVSSRFVYLFVLFGALLEATGVGRWFMDVARSIAGRTCGGAAKISVISSGLMGMLSGTAVGNVVTTGSLTIPLMKKDGYSAQFAGAVEACASTGGQLMPPVMGAAVFLMAQMVGRPYGEIMIAAVIPALCFYFALFLMVDFEARRLRLFSDHIDGVSVGTILRQSYLAVPIIMLAALIAVGYSVVYSGLISIFVLIVTAVVHHWQEKRKMIPWKILLASICSGGTGIIQISVTCAAAGIIMGSFALTGLGLKMATIIINFAHGSVFLALLLTMSITVVLGMGLPTIAAYAICASVVAPALIKMGVPELATHLFIFYFASFSAITPPVALASYAAAAIAKAPPMRLSMEAVRLGLPGFIIPYMFVYSPSLLLEGSLLGVVYATFAAMAGVCCLSAALIGHTFLKVNVLERCMFFMSAMLLIREDMLWNGAGLLIAACIVFVQYLRNR